MDDKTLEYMKVRVDRGLELKKELSYIESKLEDLNEMQGAIKLEFGSMYISGNSISGVMFENIKDSLRDALEERRDRLKQLFAEL